LFEAGGQVPPGGFINPVLAKYIREQSLSVIQGLDKKGYNRITHVSNYIWGLTMNSETIGLLKDYEHFISIDLVSENPNAQDIILNNFNRGSASPLIIKNPNIAKLIKANKKIENYIMSCPYYCDAVPTTATNPSLIRIIEKRKIPIIMTSISREESNDPDSSSGKLSFSGCPAY
jgi:hypothetical protein